MENKFQQAYKQFSNLVLGSQLRDMTATSVKNCLANLYTMDDHSKTFRYSKLSGILTLDLDRPLKTRFFRMYSMQSFQLLFECQLYYGFEQNYRPISESLWAFDFLEGIILFEFPNHGQAQQMANMVKAHSKKMDQYNKLMQERKQDEQKKRKDGTFFGEEKVQEETKVLSVKKQNSITFDPSSGKFTNIPPQLVQQFAKLGITTKDLQNKQTAQIVMTELIVFETIKQAKADPNAVALRQTVKNLQLNVKQYQKQMKLPPPPSLGAIGPPPTMPSPPTVSGRGDLLKQIQAGNFKLKPVSKQDNKITLDISNMDKDDRKDLSDHLRQALRKRNKSLRPDVDDN